jgi:hypothetical protein
MGWLLRQIGYAFSSCFSAGREQNGGVVEEERGEETPLDFGGSGVLFRFGPPCSMKFSVAPEYVKHSEYVFACSVF